jgi:C_GCAxxG_C_C family probable redox protein
MGYSGGVCGAVSGACMALGMSNPPSKDNPRQSIDKTYGQAKEFVRRFKELHGTVNCCELLGYDLTKPEKLAEAREKGVFTNLCPNLVADAVKITEELLNMK